KEGVFRHLPARRIDPQDNFDPSLGGRMRPHILYLFVQRRLGYFAFLNIDNETIVRADKSNIQTLFKFVPLTANHDSISIAVRLRTGDDRFHDTGRKSSDSFEVVAYLFLFDRQLNGIVQMLILAAAA